MPQFSANPANELAQFTAFKGQIGCILSEIKLLLCKIER